jgi:hypothetical protein
MSIPKLRFGRLIQTSKEAIGLLGSLKLTISQETTKVSRGELSPAQALLNIEIASGLSQLSCESMQNLFQEEAHFNATFAANERTKAYRARKRGFQDFSKNVNPLKTTPLSPEPYTEPPLAPDGSIPGFSREDLLGLQPRPSARPSGPSAIDFD